MRIGVVFNPRSGRRRGDRLHRMINASIIGSGHTPIFVDVIHGMRLEDTLRDLVPGLDAIAVIGGDGTLNGVVNAVLHSDDPQTPVAFFPAGRGKDAARSIPSYSVDVIGKEEISWTKARAVDVGRMSGADGDVRYFINASDIGLSAAAARFSARLPRFIGSAAYVLGAVYGFIVTKPASARLLLDANEDVVLDNLLTVAVCNGRAFGGGIYIAPDAEADDGWLDVVAVRNANLFDLLLNLPRLKRGTLRDHPALTRWRARSIVIDGTTLEPIDLDGEVWGSAPVTYAVVPGAINWIGPQQ